MESKELKKIYSKMGKQLRKQGYDVKVVMTGRQQEMGTATMCFASAMDYEASIARLEKSLTPEALEKERRETEKVVASEIRYSRSLLNSYIREGNAKQVEYWQERVERESNPDYLERRLQGYIANRKSYLEQKRKCFAEKGTLKEQYERIKTKYKELENTAAVKEFCEVAGAKAVMEIKQEHGVELFYMRFYY